MERTAENEAIAEMSEARRFNRFMRGNRFRQNEYRRLAREIVAMAGTAMRVLDIGTGSGFVAIEVAKLLRGSHCQIVGLEMSSAMLTIAAENAIQAGLDDGLTWRLGDAKTMPFADGEFDCVVSNDSLHHWEDPLRVFNEIARVLKPNGKLLIHDSKRLQQWGPRLLAWAIGRMIPLDFRIHYWNSIRSSYTPEELSQILGRSRLTGWRVIEDVMDLSVVKEA